jgi:Fe-S-cluster containining protein
MSQSTAQSFRCHCCGACCRVNGYVRLVDEDIDRIAAHLGMGVHAFTAAYTRVTRDRATLALKDQPDGSCIFLEGNRCGVQVVKPRQCKEFPEQWQYRDMAAVCPAAKESEET